MLGTESKPTVSDYFPTPSFGAAKMPASTSSPNNYTSLINYLLASLGILILKKSAMVIKSLLQQQLYTSRVGSNVNEIKSNSMH